MLGTSFDLGNQPETYYYVPILLIQETTKNRLIKQSHDSWAYAIPNPQERPTLIIVKSRSWID